MGCLYVLRFYVSILVLLDVCKEQFISFHFLLDIMVSILVLLDVCKELASVINAVIASTEFQSLFYWMYVKNTAEHQPAEVRAEEVSILVLLDVCKELKSIIICIMSSTSFQSLFYWMYVKNLCCSLISFIYLY